MHSTISLGAGEVESTHEKQRSEGHRCTIYMGCDLRTAKGKSKKSDKRIGTALMRSRRLLQCKLVRKNHKVAIAKVIRQGL